MPVCEFDFKKVGPFNQTIFLGCSVSDFNINLAWGAENSNCSITLVRDTSKHPNDSSYTSIDTLLNTTVSSTSTSTVFSPNIDSTDNSKSLFKNIAQKLVDQENYRDLEDITKLQTVVDERGYNITDVGKICWETSNISRKWYTGPDPGFIGLDHSIIGCPVYFKFHNIEFGGFIKKWDVGINGKYTVDLNSFGSLLKGCKLILKQYTGSISTLITATDGQDYAVPYGDTSVEAFGGSIAQGNTPNIFNIYGYLEHQSFGKSRVSERGVPANIVYDALIELLGGTQRTQNMFSPYGAIVARSPMAQNNGLWFMMNPATRSITIDNTAINLSELGLIKTVTAVDNQLRSLLGLDLSEVPRPPNGVMLEQIDISISDFIEYCCSNAGCSWSVDFLPTVNANFSGFIKIRTISRRVQPPNRILRNFFNSLSGNDAVLSCNVGEEFSDEDVRSICVGAPQERLYQVSSNTLSRYRSYYRFRPSDRTQISYVGHLNPDLLNTGSAQNVMREPLAYIQRWYDYAWIDGAAVAQATTATDYFATYQMAHSAMTIYQGAYQTLNPILGSFPSTNAGINSASYPLYADLISPYFGRDSNGEVRKVFFDKATSQLQIIINTRDISQLMPTFSLSGFFIVYENEIRAALSGFDNWLSYIFEMTKLGFKLGTGQLIYAYIRNTYSKGIADAVFIDGLGVLRTGGKQAAMPGVAPHGDAIRPSSGLTYTDAILDILQNLHNFFRDLGSRHYGKEFLVRLPSVRQYLDSAQIRQYDYIIADSGWEEEGNFIDDTIMIGSAVANSLSDEAGKFGVILGYNNIAEKFDKTIDSISNRLTPEGEWTKYLQQMRIPLNNDWYFPLSTEVSPEEVYWMEYITKPGEVNSGPFQRKPAIPALDLVTGSPNNYDTPFGETAPADKQYKIYIKGSTVDVANENKYNKKMLFTEFATYCVVSAGPVWIRSPRALTSIMMEDLILYDAYSTDIPGEGGASYLPGFLSALDSINISHNAAMLIWALGEGAIVDGVVRPVHPALNNVEIHARAALPCFAAIPVRLNNYTYGPWSSHPYLIRHLLFPENANNALVYTNNIVGGVKIEINPEYAPWNYGGIENLDFAVLNKIASDNNYQQVLEQGSITVAGIQYGAAGVGYRFLDNNMGPVINSIVTQVGEDGIKTSFGLRTYSRKLGFYNKETADNIAFMGKESIKRRKEIADNIRNLSFARSKNAGSSDFSDSRPKAMNWSPVSVLVGNSYPFVHKNSNLTSAGNQLKFDPQWHLRPVIPSTVTLSPKDMVRQQTNVSIYDPGELPSVFNNMTYANTSIMSMDGILSPVSFYPTEYGYTYAMVPYRRSSCPFCKGRGTISYNYLETSSIIPNRVAVSFNSLQAARTLTSNVGCNFCVPDEAKERSYKQSSRPSESIPPYIIASGDDLSIISNSQSIWSSGNPIINRYTLNPMVLSKGEFSCNTNKQNNDTCGHSVDVVAFGSTLENAKEGLRAALSNDIVKNYDSGNIRFFGLRGPLVVHGWGYDTDGYPVPNASGEYKIVNGARVLDKNGNYVYKNQILLADGTYSAPYKENAFFKSWAQLPSTWPVGPVDLRWDDSAGVWTVGNNYKSVWVVIENDLVDTTPIRGTLLEGYVDTDPLPDGLRKLVFVKDGSRLFTAPRGAAIYCKYNSNNGFYEPIYNQPFITSGTIEGASLAKIYKSYNRAAITPPDATPESYQTNFTNPMDLNTPINSIGLFIYLNGSWVLQANKG